MAFADDKEAVLDIIRENSCSSAYYIDQNATDYPSLIAMIFEFSKTFDCDTTGYLESMLDVVDDAAMMANGLYYNKTEATLTNPKIIVKSTITDVDIDAGGTFQALLITRDSIITNINITNNTLVNQLQISGASAVALLNPEIGSCIDVLLVNKCNANISILSKIAYGGCVRNFGIDDGATFGGYECPPSMSEL